jgi:hypothetical protein
MMSDPQAVQAAVKAAWDVVRAVVRSQFPVQRARVRQLRTKDNREDAAHVAGVSGAR